MSKPSYTLKLEPVVASVAQSIAGLFGGLLAQGQALPLLELLLAQLRPLARRPLSPRSPGRADHSLLLHGEAAMLEPIPCNIRAALPHAQFAPTLCVEVPPDLEVMAVPGALVVALHQLLSNHLGYAPGVPITLTSRYADAAVAPWPPEASVNLTGPVVLLTLSDQGPGIPDIRRPYLFTPRFYRSRQLRNLGLFLARALVRSQGGDLWLDETQKGASFTSVWPVSPIRWPCDPRQFGAQVRTLRRQAGLTAKELARRANLAESTVMRVERGQLPLSLRSRLRLTTTLFKHPATGPTRPNG